MKRSTDRILTTHTGSLPRPMDLSVMLEEFDLGEMPDRTKFENRVRDAVAEVVKIQLDAGVDVVSDGEQGKVGYSTYVRHRLTGFEGEGSTTARSDWADFHQAIARLPRPSTVSRPACDGPIDWKDREAVQNDISNFKAASSGVIAHFLLNQYFPTREAYLAQLADVMKQEYNAIHQAGFLLQIDCPDLAMARHLMFSDISNQDFVKIAEANVEVLNHALSDIPPDDVRMHLCWGNYEGPHHRDIPMEEIVGTVLKARPQAFFFEVANPRHEHEWEAFKNVKLPDGKIIIPGVLDSTTNYIELPKLIAQRIVRYAELVGKENVIAGSDCGFGTFARTNYQVEPGIVWAKFKTMSEGARLAGEQLWG